MLGCRGAVGRGMGEVCWGVGEARKDVWGGVWESVWGEWGSVLACGRRCGAPSHLPTSPLPHSLHLSYISRYLPHIPTHFPTPLIHFPFLPPHPNTFSYHPHISSHLLKVWRSYWQPPVLHINWQAHLVWVRIGLRLKLI